MLHCRSNHAYGCRRILAGACFVVLIGAGPLGAQTQAPAEFQERFQFDGGRGAPPSPQSAPAPEQKDRGTIEKLIVPSAGAEPASPGGTAASDSAPARGAARVSAERARPGPSAGRRIGRGRAAWYEHPGRTASGEKYDPDGLTAAHKSLPLGTLLRVVNLRNQRSVIVRVNDRAPPRMKFVIDLSRGSARAIGIKDVGTVALYEVN